MTIQVFEGQKNEIAERIAKISGTVTRAIVWVEEPAASARDVESILAELEKDTVSVGLVDDSTEALYTRLEDE